MKWILSFFSMLPLAAVLANGATTYKPAYPPYHKPPLYSKDGQFPYRGPPFYFKRFKGAYMGVGGGGVLNSARGFIRVVPAQTANNFTLRYVASPTIRNRSVVGSLFFGYGFQASNFYAGFEAGAQIAKHALKWARVTRGNNQVIDYNSKLEPALVEFYVDLLPGFAFETSTLVYLRIGLTLGDINLLGRVQFIQKTAGKEILILSNTTTKGSQSPFSQTDDVPGGFRIGFGVEQYLAKNFSLRFDWIFTDYGGIAKGNYATDQDNCDGASQTTRYGSLTTQTFLLSALYRFNL